MTHCNIFSPVEVTFDFPYRDSFIHGTKLCPGGASFKHMVVRKTRIREVEFETKLRLAAQNDTFNYSQIYVGGGGISLKVEFRSGSKPTEEYSKARSNNADIIDQRTSTTLECSAVFVLALLRSSWILTSFHVVLLKTNRVADDLTNHDKYALFSLF